MKTNRQNAILEIIEDFDIETQEDLANRLYERGFNVTQATISRDIKELHLIKTQTDKSTYKYTVNETSRVLNTERLLRVFRDTVTDIQVTGNIIVVRTLSGSANAAAEVVDNMDTDSILGTIAGDNTIFVAVKNGEAQPVAHMLKKMASK